MANNLAILDNVHNFYMTTYADKTNSPYDTHKKSELRGVYNSIVKINKDAPLYILDNTQESRQYAIGLKENARSLKNTIASVGGMDEEDILNKKTASSTNPNLATAEFIGEYDPDAPTPEFEMEVKSLASPQINLGRYLNDDDKVDLPADTYSFDVSINDLKYEFQFNIKDTDTNIEVEERLSRLINNSNIGLSAEVVHHKEDEGRSYLRLESVATGARNGNGIMFEISDDATSKSAGAVEYLGIDFMARTGRNAEFTINGEDRSASSNDFTVGKMYEVHLAGVSENGETTRIGLMTDVESMTENLNTLIGGYNSFVRAAAEYSSSHPMSSRLVNEMAAITRTYAEGLTSAGVNLNLDGTLELDEEGFAQSVRDGSANETFSSIKNFTQSLLRKSDQVSLNPMTYVDKTIVAYKNPGRSFASPYTTSAYSGMLFNSYC